MVVDIIKLFSLLDNSNIHFRIIKYEHGHLFCTFVIHGHLFCTFVKLGNNVRKIGNKENVHGWAVSSSSEVN